MKPEQKAKLERFFDDTLLAETVFDILMKSFTRPIDSMADVHFLAASYIAIDRFREGWKELEKYKRKEAGEQLLERNVGL